MRILPKILENTVSYPSRATSGQFGAIAGHKDMKSFIAKMAAPVNSEKDGVNDLYVQGT